MSKYVHKLIQNLKYILFIDYMVLTQNQKNQLNKDILEYMVKSDYTLAAQKFAEEIGANLSDVDPEGNKLEIKWKSILTLQKKINNLEDEVKYLKQELEKAPNKKSGNASQNTQELYLPKTKFELKGHKSNITSIAFHPQYTQVATSSDDGTVKIWQFETGDFERTLKGHTNPVNCVSYDSQGKYLASCSSDLTIKLWDLNNDFLCYKTLFGHNHNVSSVVFTPGGDNIISSSRDKTIKLWQVSTGYCKRTFIGHEAWVRRVVISKDGELMASGSDDQSIMVWNINKDNPVHKFIAHDNVIQTILLVEGETSAKLMNAEFLKSKFTPEAKMNALKQLNEKGANGISHYFQTFLLSGSRDKLIKLFVCQTGELLHTFYGHDNWVRCLTMHSSGKYLYSCSDDKSVRIWDMNFGKQKKKVEAHDHFVAAVQFNQKYGVIATGGNDFMVKIWHLK